MKRATKYLAIAGLSLLVACGRPSNIEPRQDEMTRIAQRALEEVAELQARQRHAASRVANAPATAKDQPAANAKVTAAKTLLDKLKADLDAFPAKAAALAKEKKVVDMQIATDKLVGRIEDDLTLATSYIQTAEGFLAYGRGQATAQTDTNPVPDGQTH